MIEVDLVIVVLFLFVYVTSTIGLSTVLGNRNREIRRLVNRLEMERKRAIKRAKYTKIPVKALIPGHVIIDRTVRVAVETAPQKAAGPAGKVYFGVTPMDVIGGMYTTSYDNEDVLVEVEVDSE